MKKVLTHSGDFHADDVFAVATLKILLGDIEIIRSRDPEEIEGADYVVDVGSTYDPQLKRFDHHQVGGAGMRENEIPYAAFGLVWKEYGERIVGSSDIQKSIDESLVQPIDALDNGVEISTPLIDGVYPTSINSLVGQFRPTWKEESSEEILLERFLMLVEVAEVYLRRMIKTSSDYIEAQKEVAKIYTESKDKRLIILNEGYPWHGALSELPEPLFVVYPRSDGSWGVRAVTKEGSFFENKKDLPKEWAGRQGEELQKITGVSDAVFAHNKQFLAVAKSKEGALKLAELALQS